MTSFFVASGIDGLASSSAKEAEHKWLRFKRAANAATLRAPFASATVIGNTAEDASFHDVDTGSWIVCAGTWIHKFDPGVRGAAALLKRYLLVGADVLARELEGVFSIVVCDTRGSSVVVITDPMGSLHTYLRRDGASVWISTSSIALSDAQTLDPLGLAEYLAMGIIYEDRSLWRGVRKLAPGTVTVVQEGKESTRVYWGLVDAFSSRLSLKDASEAMMNQLVVALKQLSAQFPRGVSDLTGGYDSRLLLCAILEAGLDLEYTVAGSPDSADVHTAQSIAGQLGLTLNTIENVPAVSVARFQQAIALSDGEYNAFDYARILESQGPMAQRFDMSLNGSYGEVARGYWWELLWPHIDKVRPLDAGMVARKRFAAQPFVNLFKEQPFDSLVVHMGGVIQRTAEPFQDFPLGSQMDAVYLSMRMQRWQGRIASNTNQIWPSLSPLGFTSVLSPILAAVPSARFRSRMPRHIFSKWNPLLAAIPLEHGYPPAEATLRNLHQFAPLLGLYYGKAAKKIGPRLSKAIGRLARKDDSQSQTLFASYDQGEMSTGRHAAQAPMLLASGLFHEERLQQFLNPPGSISDTVLEQWQRLVSLEQTLEVFAS